MIDRCRVIEPFSEDPSLDIKRSSMSLVRDDEDSDGLRIWILRKGFGCLHILNGTLLSSNDLEASFLFICDNEEQ